MPLDWLVDVVMFPYLVLRLWLADGERVPPNKARRGYNVGCSILNLCCIWCDVPLVVQGDEEC